METTSWPRSSRRRRARPAATATATAPAAAGDPVVAPGSPSTFRARVRMYRHGLGDCFLLTLPRSSGRPFHVLIDCGVLDRDADHMKRFVAHIRDTIRHASGASSGPARSTSSSARTNTRTTSPASTRPASCSTMNSISAPSGSAGPKTLPSRRSRRSRRPRSKAVKRLKAALDSPAAALGPGLEDAGSVFGFSQDDDTTGSGKIAEALEYLKLRGAKPGIFSFSNPAPGRSNWTAWTTCGSTPSGRPAIPSCSRAAR